MISLERSSKNESASCSVDVEADGADLAGLQAVDDRLGVDEGAARGVDQDEAVLGAGDRLGVDEMVRLGGERAVQRDDVGAGDEVVALDIGDADLLQGVHLVAVVRQHLAAEAQAEGARDEGADAAGADDADGARMQVVAEQTVEERCFARAQARWMRRSTANMSATVNSATACGE